MCGCRAERNAGRRRLRLPRGDGRANWAKTFRPTIYQDKQYLSLGQIYGCGEFLWVHDDDPHFHRLTGEVRVSRYQTDGA